MRLTLDYSPLLDLQKNNLHRMVPPYEPNNFCYQHFVDNYNPSWDILSFPIKENTLYTYSEIRSSRISQERSRNEGNDRVALKGIAAYETLVLLEWN